MRVKGSRGHGRPKKQWSDTINADLRWLDLDRSDVSDGVRWKSLVELGVRQKQGEQYTIQQNGMYYCTCVSMVIQFIGLNVTFCFGCQEC